ncbi:MAG: hypothetical protein Ct9H300mP25_16070 [Acidobacteriota bacterium]|nr:MAG: hypothetical protein Ct9H300mP25_16070 [Acidobacteriota bacterium]
MGASIRNTFRKTGAVSLAALLGVMVIPAYVGAMSSAALAVGAVVMGACGQGCGAWCHHI